MFIILGVDGKEYGPVPASKIQEWISGGRANFQTKARRAEETEWRTLADYPEFSNAPTPAPSMTVAPMIRTSAPIVPATPSATTGTPAEIAARVQAQAASFSVFHCFGRSFELWKAHLLPLVGVTFVSLAIQFVLGMIPLVSIANSFFFTGVFTGGLYYYYLGKIRGEPRAFADIFAGFTKALANLGLTNLLMMGLILIVMLPFFIPLMGAIVAMAASQQGDSHVALPAVSFGMMALSALAIIPLLYLTISWIFAYALVIDQQLGPWTALETSRRIVARCWFRMFGLCLCGMVLCVAGGFLLVVGFFFVVPIVIGALLYAYEDLCVPASSSSS